MDTEANHRAEVVMCLPIASSNRAAQFDWQLSTFTSKQTKVKMILVQNEYQPQEERDETDDLIDVFSVRVVPPGSGWFLTIALFSH
jgi:hypothetical protein